MMLTHMLDTDTVSFALRGMGAVPTRLLERRPSELCMSAVTMAELRFGADLRKSRKLHGLIDTFAATIRVVPFDNAAAIHFGTVATQLTRKGTPIGNYDTLIAAHALSLKLALVTNNAKHFERVHGLQTESWL